jgi:hypothetical protein
MQSLTNGLAMSTAPLSGISDQTSQFKELGYLLTAAWSDRLRTGRPLQQGHLRIRNSFY